MRIRGSLRRDSTASAGDDAREAAHEISGDVCPQPELLIVPVAGHQEVQAIILVELPVEGLILTILAAREVRHHDLPRGLGLAQLLLEPHLLLGPELLEVCDTSLDGHRAADHTASRTRRVVRGAADVVLGVLRGLLGIVEIGVGHEEVDGEALIHVLDTRHVIRRRHHPTVADPSVGDLLIPAVVELAAAPIMVAEDAEPRLAIEARALVHLLVDLVELVVRCEGNLAHRRAASLFNATPIEVVADIED
mmetsp:Transcript_44155/g.113633  ORF Transcript_44155/g.113633 Transcript_44155/m.113633 type:complete len:250 (+) Transcript_44155:341-1090(+)